MAAGDISAVIDTLVLTGCTVPRMVVIDGDYVVVSAYDGSLHGHIHTFTVDNVGAISDTVVDTWDFASTGLTPTILKIPGASDKYLLGYEGPASEGFIKSMTISTTGVITESFIDTVSTGARLVFGELLHTANAGDIGIAQCYLGVLESFSCDVDGNIGAAILDVEDYGHTPADPDNVIAIDGDYYVAAYADVIETFSVDVSGAITAVDSWDWGTESKTKILKIPGTTTYLMATKNTDTFGYIRSFTISNTGVITKSFIDNLKFEGTKCSDIISIIHCGGDYFAVSGVGGTDGFNGLIYTFECDSSGNIGAAVLDSMVFYDHDDYAGKYCAAPFMTYIQDDVYAVVHYRQSSFDGWVRSFTIEIPTGAIEETATFNSNSHIWDTETATFSSDSNISDIETETKTFNSNSHIWDTVTATFNSNSHIWDTETATFSSDSHLYTEATFSSNSYISTDGDISDVIDTQAVAVFQNPDIVHLDGDYVAVVGFDASNDGYVRTYTIDITGDISNTEVDSWLYDSVGPYPKIISIPGATDKYLLPYRESGGAGYTKSLTISINGVITKSFIDTLTTTGNFFEGQIFHTGNANNICFSNGFAGVLDSYTVDSGGNISASVIDTQDYGHATSPGNIININANYYVTVYDDDIETFSIDGSGNITAVDSWTSPAGTYTRIIKVPSSTIYIVAHVDGSNDGELFTLTISDTGVITKSTIDTLIFEAGICVEIGNILYLGGDYFAVVSRGGNGGLDGVVYTFSCDRSGNISNSVLDSLEFYDGTVNTCFKPRIIYVQGIIYAVVYYYQSSNSGFITTFSIEAPSIETATFNSNSYLYTEETATFNSDSHIWDTETATFNSDSYVWNVEIFNSNSHIWDTEIAT
ncbi:hypothetical protein LCGC14_1271340, partial [marine sediment metagenome]